MNRPSKAGRGGISNSYVEKRCIITQQENQARELYKKLMQAFANSSQALDISINKPGLHWNCSLIKDKLQCTIYCFGANGFYISFSINDVAKAKGRTKLENEVIASAKTWLNGIELNEMLDNFEFIDPGKRTLEIFQEKLIGDYTDFEQYATVKLGPGLRETFCIKITSSNRHCHIHYNNDSKIPTCEFYWEDFYIFKFLLVNKSEAVLILKRWFCENVAPSVLAKEFPFLDKDELSEYSDFGKFIEAEFRRSWDEVEKFYKEFPLIFDQFYKGLPLKTKQEYLGIVAKQDYPRILSFISQLRAKGYDSIFRAGTVLLALVLSRAMHHGLNYDQPRLIFDFSDYDKINIYTSDGARSKCEANYSTSKFLLDPQIERLLKELEAQDID